jgi:hypothetical protein
MNASQLIQIQQQRELYASSYLGGRGVGLGDAVAGARQIYLKGIMIADNMPPGVAAGAATQPASRPVASAQDVALELFEATLAWVQRLKKGPTVTARILYIWFFSAAAAWAAVETSAAGPTGTIDGWNWNWRAGQQPATGDWLLATLGVAMRTFLPGFDGGLAAVPAATEWLARWQAWWAARSTDGSTSLPAPTIADISNINYQLDPLVAGTPAGILPGKWTPLLVGGVKQNYLTLFWGDVRSSCLTAADESTAEAAAGAVINTANRADEVADVVEKTAALNDMQKMSAEFWAGGPGTATPPGALSWFWAEFCRQSRPSDSDFFLSGLDLGIHLFEGSRIIWRLKAKYMQARPIQEIRIRYGGQPLRLWDGTMQPANMWTPYQEANFVSPPFADFPSGHSYFSAGFAAVMTHWFGSQIGGRLPAKRLDFLSPVVSTGLAAAAGASTIQPGIVPAAPVQFTWSTWDDIALDAGMSRLYGGIHCLSAHEGSRAAADSIDRAIRTRWWGAA